MALDNIKTKIQISFHLSTVISLPDVSDNARLSVQRTENRDICIAMHLEVVFQGSTFQGKNLHGKIFHQFGFDKTICFTRKI